MIIGQPGSGKSTFAKELGTITHLPVFHIDHIHWKPGRVEPSGAEKNQICAEVHARERWIVEGGGPVTWGERLERADTLIWLDFPLIIRGWRVFRRMLLNWGRVPPDLPEGCPRRFSLEFARWIWKTRHTGRRLAGDLYANAPDEKTKLRLRSRREVGQFLAALRWAAARGNLGISHR
jgi:adenylate kinase family enzyme